MPKTINYYDSIKQIDKANPKAWTKIEKHIANWL